MTGSNIATWVPSSANLITPIGPLTVLDVPSPYGPRGSGVVGTDSPIHPAPLYIPQGFAGYKFILAFTPYPGGDSQYENPCVVVSNDGLKFIVPPGGANPIVPRPALNGYNADTHIVLSPDQTKIYLIWRERNAGNNGLNRIMVSDTTDLVTWSAPVAIKTDSISAAQDFASPSIWYDPDANQWVSISHNLDNAHEMQRMTCPGNDIYGAWGSPVNITIGGTYWHSYFSRLIDGRVLGVVMSDGTGGPGSLSFAESLDGGQTFSVIPSDFKFSQWYRSSFFICPDESGRLDLVLTYYLGSYALVRFPCNFMKQERRAANRIVPVTSAPQAGVLVSDSFNRADGAIGNADTGQTPTTLGTVTVSSNAATVATSGNNRIVWEAGSANAIARAKIRTLGTEFWLVARYTNSSTFWRVGRPAGSSGNYQLQKIVSGVITNVGTLLWRPDNGDLVSMACSGNSLSVSVNGIEIYKTIDSDSNAGTKFGLQGTGATATFFEAFEVLPA